LPFFLHVEDFDVVESHALSFNFSRIRSVIADVMRVAVETLHFMLIAYAFESSSIPLKVFYSADITLQSIKTTKILQHY
jgi:hypothetical protein